MIRRRGSVSLATRPPNRCCCGRTTPRTSGVRRRCRSAKSPWAPIGPASCGHRQARCTARVRDDVALPASRVGGERVPTVSQSLDSTSPWREPGRRDAASRRGPSRFVPSGWCSTVPACRSSAVELVKRRALPLHVTVLHDDPAFAVEALRSRRYFALTPWGRAAICPRCPRRRLRWTSSPMVMRVNAIFATLRRGLRSSCIGRSLDRWCTGACVRRHCADCESESSGTPILMGRPVARSCTISCFQSARGYAPESTMVGQGFADRLSNDLAGNRGRRRGARVTSARTRLSGCSSQCFALYLNYPFDQRDVPCSARPPFPTKLCDLRSPRGAARRLSCAEEHHPRPSFRDDGVRPFVDHDERSGR